MNLYEKIQAVSNRVKNISKDMTVGSGSYSYKAVSDNQVTQLVKEAETEFKILSIPIKQECVNSQIVRAMNKYDKEVLYYVEDVKMTIRLIDLEDTTQFVDVETYGKGLDTGDKGFGKASTYARKYGLLNAYKIPTGEDLDIKPSETTTAKKKQVEPTVNMAEINKAISECTTVEQLKGLRAKYGDKLDYVGIAENAKAKYNELK